MLNDWTKIVISRLQTKANTYILSEKQVSDMRLVKTFTNPESVVSA